MTSTGEGVAGSGGSTEETVGSAAWSLPHRERNTGQGWAWRDTCEVEMGIDSGNP